MSSGPVVEAEAIEEQVAAGEDASGDEPVRPLPARRSPTELNAWKGDVRALAVVAAGGLAAGAVTIAAVSAAKSVAGGRSRRTLRRTRPDRDVIASRSFLVDVHLLGR
jgi:hypothetical protein